MSLAGIRKAFGKHAAAVMIFFGVATLVTSFAWNINGRINPIAARAEAPEDVVAVVDGVNVTRRQYDRTLHDPNSQFAQVSSNPMLQGFIRKQVFDTLTQEAEFYAAAKRLGLKATDAQIAKFKDDILTQSHIRTALGLAANATWDDVNNSLQQKGEEPLDTRYPPDEMAEEIVIKQLADSLKGAPVTEQDARNSFKQYHVQHILVDNKKRSDAQAKVLAAELITKLQAGASFTDLAKQDSDDPGTSKKGGDDGWIDVHTSYVPEFKDAAFALAPGTITNTPVPSPSFGYFIIKSVAIRDTTPKDFDKRKASVMAALANDRQQMAEQGFANTVKNAPHTIVIKDPVIRGFKDSDDADAMPPGPQQTDMYNKTIAEFQSTLKNKANPDVAAVQVRLAQIYQRLNQPDKAIAAYEAALQATDDPQLQMTLGDLYKQQKNVDMAVQHYQSASTDAWDDPQIHQQLVGAYKQLDKADLAAKETAWLADYAKQHKPQTPAMGSLPGNIRTVVGGGTAPGAPAVGAVSVKPVAGGAPATAPKPTQ